MICVWINWKITMDICSAYNMLNLSPEASPEQVRNAYRKLVRRWHPDQFANQADKRRHAEETLKEINLAYAMVKGQLQVKQKPSRHQGKVPKNAANQVDSEYSWRFFLKALRRFLDKRSFQKPSGPIFKHMPRPSRTDRTKTRAKSFQQVFDDMFETGNCKTFRSSRKRARIQVQRSGRALDRKRPRSGPLSPIRPVSRVRRVSRIS